MTPGHPVPPIINHWDAWSLNFCAGWATPYADRIRQWKRDINPELTEHTFMELS